MSNKIVQSARPILKDFKAVLSTSHSEARRRVLNLYKLWFRQVPYVGKFLKSLSINQLHL
jgi:hypothetical protein